MVVTRSMSGTSKTTNTNAKISVNHKSATKKTDTNTKISVNHKAAKRPSKRAKSQRTEKVDGFYGKTCVVKDGWPLDLDAFTIFMRNDYLKKYYQNRPPPTYGITPFEVSCAGQLEWRGMSAKDKAPFRKLAREMRAEGRSFFSF
ncbi:uncharacterized protein LOC108192590 isoform X1 [Daucus carota subsp. sativus]|uniref:uncharacterized protein LOC108192590 isoform X1 n=1 Tax=Daucus carota subsp. sativus TaxID=79200 RepID=UPI0030833635